ncbi:MAG: hypothetical protein GYA55_04655 [SAR324 cluster bacterium]|uniref:Uncharacterized protein n=1 Tax=SAR324 cluster bacterium TaxID=2024889 RepID=A0A7X9FRF9_9DELT|nr:hypothetical protein [SAR324 cluster bacterium]
MIRNGDFYWICERALVHDLNKLVVTIRKNAKGACLGEDVYSISAYEKLKTLFIEAGISESFAEFMTEAGSKTGHNSLEDFIEIGLDDYRGLVHGKIAGKRVHLEDDMTFTNNPQYR